MLHDKGTELFLPDGNGNRISNIFNHKGLSELFENGRIRRVRQDMQSRCLSRLEILREDILPALGLSVSETARRLGISIQQLHRVLACTHPITTEMALRIGKFAGNGPGLWLRMQQAYDLWHRTKDERQISPLLVQFAI